MNAAGPVEPGRRRGCGCGCFSTLFALLLIAGIFLYFAVRTDVARQALERRWSAWSGLDASIGASRLAPWPPALKLQDVVLRGRSEGHTGIVMRAEGIALAPGRPGVQVHLQHPELYLDAAAVSTGAPPWLRELAALPRVVDVARVRRPWPGHVAWVVEQGGVTWGEGPGGAVARVAGLDGSARAVRLSSRVLQHYRMTAERVETPATRAHGASWEWLDAGPSQVMVFAGDPELRIQSPVRGRGTDEGAME